MALTLTVAVRAAAAEDPARPRGTRPTEKCGNQCGGERLRGGDVIMRRQEITSQLLSSASLHKIGTQRNWGLSTGLCIR